MSKAERKKLKKSGGVVPPPAPLSTKKKAKQTINTDFRDNEHYMDVSQKNSQRSADVEAALQPSFGFGKDSKSSALAMQSAMLDIVGDENKDMVSKTRIMRWDKQKRKYIQTTVGDEASGMTHAKKVRLESGHTVKGKKAKLGDLYVAKPASE